MPLRTSNQVLSPLEDPLWTDCGLHRWLHGSREETYSDWLAWILQGFENAAQVFEVFDLEVGGSEEWPNFSITREGTVRLRRRYETLQWWMFQPISIVATGFLGKLSARRFGCTSAFRLCCNFCTRRCW